MFTNNKRAKIGAFDLISLGMLGAVDNDSNNINEEASEEHSRAEEDDVEKE